MPRELWYQYGILKYIKAKHCGRIPKLSDPSVSSVLIELEWKTKGKSYLLVMVTCSSLFYVSVVTFAALWNLIPQSDFISLGLPIEITACIVMNQVEECVLEKAWAKWLHSCFSPHCCRSLASKSLKNFPRLRARSSLDKPDVRRHTWFVLHHGMLETERLYELQLFWADPIEFFKIVQILAHLRFQLNLREWG